MSTMTLPAAVDLEWQTEGLCRQTDPEGFFPDKGGSTTAIKRVCNGDGARLVGCPVRDACLAYALANDERFGVWGGLSERQRRRLKKAQEAAQEAAQASVKALVEA